ncbi:MAG TPA: VTT domain-containing protein [Bryobacteraceae bacterium]|nr:VTT domain-containing protein [Bryobacteraceae bacterium]
MKELIATLLSWGLGGLFVAALLDGVGLPVPSGVDVLVVYLATRLDTGVFALAVVAVLGSVAGNMLLFALARRGGKAFLERRVRSKRSLRLRSWFDRYGLSTVFVSALVPLPVMPMKIFVFCAGALGVHPGRFAVVFVGARIPRYLGLAMLGRAMGDDALGWLGLHVWHLAGFAALLLVVLVALVRHAERATARGGAVVE